MSVEAVTKRCGHVSALSDVSLDLAAGKLTAVLGPSGCGKTTPLRGIAGFVAVDAGAIRFDGENVTHLPAQRRGVAMVFQNYALWPHMTVFDNVAYGLRLKRVPGAEIRARVRAALELVEDRAAHVTSWERPPRPRGCVPAPRAGTLPAPHAAAPREPQAHRDRFHDCEPWRLANRRIR